MKLLEAFDLYRFFHVEEEETLALKGVSVYLESGEILAVQGPSGSGKSTLLACLAGLDEPDGGHVALMGKRITRKPETERASLRARMIGIMLQSGNLFDHLSVEDNIRLQLHLAEKGDAQARVNELLELVDLAHVRHARPSQLSGGEAARAGLAVAVSSRPKVLLADEPTGEVDFETEKRILHLLDAYRKEGAAVMMVTHSAAAAACADRAVQLLDGRVVDDQ